MFNIFFPSRKYTLISSKDRVAVQQSTHRLTTDGSLTVMIMQHANIRFDYVSEDSVVFYF